MTHRSCPLPNQTSSGTVIAAWSGCSIFTIKNWNNLHLNLQNSGDAKYFFFAKTVVSVCERLYKGTLTFQDRQEANDRDCSFVCMAHMVANVAYWQVQGPVFSVARGYWDNHLVTAEDYWDKHWPMCWRVSCNFILSSLSTTYKLRINKKNALLDSKPSPLT